jgi:hypothetical protein
MLNISRRALQLSTLFFGTPSIVKVFLDPIRPCVKMHTLKPSITNLTTGKLSANTASERNYLNMTHYDQHPSTIQSYLKIYSGNECICHSLNRIINLTVHICSPVHTMGLHNISYFETEVRVCTK